MNLSLKTRTHICITKFFSKTLMEMLKISYFVYKTQIIIIYDPFRAIYMRFLQQLYAQSKLKKTYWKEKMALIYLGCIK